MSGKKLMTITVRGNNKAWSFGFYGDPRNLDYWRNDGLEVDEVLNTIPQWAVELGLTRIWCVFQDIFNFKNPWSGK